MDEKSAQMDEYIKRGYIEDLQMTVHSLKSTSVAVGAKQISEMAKLLEKACVEYNIPLVYSLTPEFI
ncbi:MAG: Hpt domain-containing protein [Lachnospiraceae bacterium]|nr:Hpt domain-containing protein [Lachnospiraceae bacterium]